MSSSQSAPNSQTPLNDNFQPSSTPELQSAPTGTNSNSSPEPLVIEIANDDVKEEEELEKKPRSEVWAHFNKVKIEGVLKAVCKYCQAKLRGDSGAGTSHLRSHFKTKHHNKGQSSIRQKLLASNFNKDHPELTSYNFSHDGAKKVLAEMIIMHEYPLSIVDHIGFKKYSSYLQPLFKVPCRNTMKNEIFQIYELERAKTLSLLENNKSRVAITTDMWTASNQKKGYMAVTGHYIDDSWTLQSRIMRFIYVPCPHTKDVLCDQLLECLMDWNLDRKLSCLTVDNCSTNDAMIELMLEKLDSSSLIAALLDPRYKMEVLEFYFEKIFGEGASTKVDNVRDQCYSLLKEYHQRLVVRSEGIGDSSTATGSSSIPTSESASQYDLFISTKKRKRVDSVKAELDHYLDEDVVQKSDVLTWWKVNELKYPTLQLMARDFLAVPASTVASESAFSTSGRVVSPHRNRLHPKTIEALMCAQSWLWSAEIPDEASTGYATIYNDLELEDSCITREV